VNQPLAAIVANSHACYRWLSADPVNIERAKITTERVIRDANSAAEVVGRIRALFKQSVENRAILVLSDVISEACSLVAGEALRRRIRIDIDVESNLSPVTVTASRFSRSSSISFAMAWRQWIPSKEKKLSMCARIAWATRCRPK
jgi:C4-dicarboxylate-specific signal transduction histidine kinase